MTLAAKTMQNPCDDWQQIVGPSIDLIDLLMILDDFGTPFKSFPS